MRQSAVPARFPARLPVRSALRRPVLAAALLPLLLLGATACQSAPEGASLAPAAAPPSPWTAV